MHVSHLRFCALKGTRHVDHTAAEVVASGVVGDRTHAVVDPATLRVLKTVDHPALSLVTASFEAGRLGVTFPDGRVVTQDAVPGAQVEVSYWGRPIPARLVPGAVSDALAAHLRRPVVVVAARGAFRFIYGHPVGVWFAGELRALEERVGATLDPRRFRLAIGLEGDGVCAAGLVGRTLAVGDVQVVVAEPIVRCPIVDWDVETGSRDQRVLARLGEGGVPVFGYGCTVRRPGVVLVGDAASVGLPA